MATESDDGGPQHRCGSTDTDDGEPCQFPVSGPDQRCHMHPADGSGPPEGHGSGSPDHHMGDGDGKIQERLGDNAKPALKHGLNCVEDDPSGTLAWMEDHEQQAYDWIIDKWRSYIADAPFGEDTAKADDILTACLYDYAVRSWTSRQIQDGLTQLETRTSDSGHTFEVEVEQAGNLPADRLARRSEEIKRKYGLLDDPESQKADAMGWGQAAKEVAMEIDSDVEDVDAHAEPADDHHNDSP